MLELQKFSFRSGNLRLIFLFRRVKNSNFRFEYFREIESIFENALACKSGAQMGSEKFLE